jgi:hypothetical protein
MRTPRENLTIFKAGLQNAKYNFSTDYFILEVNLKLWDR